MAKFEDQVVLFYAMFAHSMAGGRLKPPVAFSMGRDFLAEAKKQFPEMFPPKSDPQS